MWELIKSNQRKSAVLFIGLAVCLLLLGYLIGVYFFYPDGGAIGVLIASAIWIVMAIIGSAGADSIFLSLSGAKEITHDIHPQLFNIAEEMKIAAGLPKVPRLYIINDTAPNAFATGMSLDRCSIAVTTGLLSRLNRDELQGVIAHETSHILNRDMKYMTQAGIILGGITILSEIFLRGMRFSSGSSRRYSSGRSSGGQGQIIIIIIAIAFAILAPIMARLLYFAISRKREYLADASGARLTRYPEGLASALEKISMSYEDLQSANKAMAPMYIVNPFKQRGQAVSNLSSTHPPIDERINILRSMMHGSFGANFIDYQKAYQTVKGINENIIPKSGLSDTASITIREASVDSVEPIKKARENFRNIGDLTRAINGFVFVNCSCGVKFKVPPDFEKSKIICPRCAQEVEIPKEDIAALSMLNQGALEYPKFQESNTQTITREPQTYIRKTAGWETVRCNCGHLMNISPLFRGTNMQCPKCSNTLLVQSE